MAKNSGPVRTVHAPTTGKEREEMIATTKAEIEKKFGRGSRMRYDRRRPQLEVEAIPTGALALDVPLWISAVCTALSSRYRPRPPVRRRFCSRSWPKPRQWVT